MLTRAEPVTPKTSFRAMVPMSVVAEDGLPTSLGSKVRGHLLSLPVGESNPVVRLHQVSYALKDHRETGSAVAANKLANLPGFATSTFHAVGARVADAEAGRGHQIVITNVPGPQEPVYMAGEAVSEVYPCIPLSGRRAVSIGVTSYNSKVFFGIVADREAVPDVDVLAQCIEDALLRARRVRRGPAHPRAPRPAEAGEVMRVYLAVGRDELTALAAGAAISAPAFLAGSEDEEDELAALEEASEHAAAVAAAEVDDPDGPVTLDDVVSFHLDVDGTGDLAWYATQEIDAVLSTLAGPSTAS